MFLDTYYFAISFYTVFKAHLIVFRNSRMTLTSSNNLFHILSIAIHIDNGQPIVSLYNKHFNPLSDFYITLLANLQILYLKYGHFSSLQACNKSLDIKIFLSYMIAHLLYIHQIMTTKILRMNVLCLLLFF